MSRGFYWTEPHIICVYPPGTHPKFPIFQKWAEISNFYGNFQRNFPWKFSLFKYIQDVEQSTKVSYKHIKLFRNTAPFDSVVAPMAFEPSILGSNPILGTPTFLFSFFFNLKSFWCFNFLFGISFFFSFISRKGYLLKHLCLFVLHTYTR